MSLLQSLENTRKTLSGFVNANVDNLTVEEKVRFTGFETGIDVSSANHIADLTKTFTIVETTHGSNVKEVWLPHGGSENGLIHEVSNGDSAGASVNVKSRNAANDGYLNFVGGGSALALAVGGGSGIFVWNTDLNKWIIIGGLE